MREAILAGGGRLGAPGELHAAEGEAGGTFRSTEAGSAGKHCHSLPRCLHVYRPSILGFNQASLGSIAASEGCFYTQHMSLFPSNRSITAACVTLKPFSSFRSLKSPSNNSSMRRLCMGSMQIWDLSNQFLASTEGLNQPPPPLPTHPEGQPSMHFND